MNNKYIIGLLAFSLLFHISCKKDIYSTKDVSCDNPLIQNTHPKATAYQALLEEYVAKGFPGMSMLIEDSSGVWVGSAGMADITEEINFSPCHVSKAASITKLMVNALTMILQEEGVLDIDDPISKYIDADILNKLEHPSPTNITLKDLMTHQTRLFDVIKSNAFYLEIINNPAKDWTGEELLRFVYGQPLDTLFPGNPARYSNTNTLLLSICLDVAANRPHAELLHEKVLDPLGMTNTYYQSREELPDITAQGYFDLHNNETLTNVSNFITGSGNGYGGIFSNVFDLKIFLDALLIDKSLLSQASLDEMQAEYYASSTIAYTGELVQTGVGFLRKFTYPSPSADAAEHASLHGAGLGHSGKDLGYSANMFYFEEEGQSMIFFINYGTDGNSYLKEVFWDFENDLMNLMFQ